jgi:hypothetical protein
MVMAEREGVETESDQLLWKFVEEAGTGLSTVLIGSQRTLAGDIAALLAHNGWTFKPYVWEFAPVDEQLAKDRLRLIAEVTGFLCDIWCPDTNTVREMIDITGIAIDVAAVVPVRAPSAMPECSG